MTHILKCDRKSAYGVATHEQHSTAHTHTHTHAHTKRNIRAEKEKDIERKSEKKGEKGKEREGESTSHTAFDQSNGTYDTTTYDYEVHTRSDHNTGTVREDG